MEELFKQCSFCLHDWMTRDGFLADLDVHLVGYQSNFGDLEAGLFLFNHDYAGCGTTLAIEAARFRYLYDGPVFSERLTLTDQCPGYCMQQGELRPCPARCECAYAREVLNIIKNWPKG